MVPQKRPNSLLKFVDSETAIKLLTNAKLRWSSPCLFEDPFELDHNSELNYDSPKLLSACVKATLSHIFSRDEPRGTSPLIKAVRRWRAEDRFESEEEAEEVLTELLSGMVKQREPDLLRLMRDWKDYSTKVRILCLSETHENIDSWERYADNHRGVSVRFACGEDFSLDSPLAMEYSDKKPEISSLSEQIDVLMHQSRNEVQDRFQSKFLCRPKVASRDREWRLIRTASATVNPDDSKTWFEDIAFLPHEVRAIYLGASLSANDELALKKLIVSKYPKAKLYRAKPQHNRFELDFERLQD